VADVERYYERLRNVLRDVAETDLEPEAGEALWQAGREALAAVGRALAVCRGREAAAAAAAEAKAEAAGPSSLCPRDPPKAE